MAKSRPDPWERQPKESDVAFAAFVAYRDLGLMRSLAKAADQLRKPKRQLEEWSSRHSWRIRVSAWDAEVDRIDRLELLDLRRQMRDRHVTLAVDLQDKVVAALETLTADPVSTEKFLADPTAMIRWVDVATKLERAALGEPDRHEHSLTNGAKASNPDEIDFDVLSDEEIHSRMVELQRELASELNDYEAQYSDHDEHADQDVDA